MSSGTDAALQEVLEELSVPARRAPPPPRPAPGPRPPAPARSEAPTGGPARRQAADIAARRRRPSDTSTTCSSVDVELQHESLTNLWRMAGGGGSGRRGRTRGLRRARARARAQGGGHAAAAEEGDRAVQAAGRDREARGGEDQQGPAALLPHRAAAQHQEGAGPGEGRQERARAAARARARWTAPLPMSFLVCACLACLGEHAAVRHPNLGVCRNRCRPSAPLAAQCGRAAVPSDHRRRGLRGRAGAQGRDRPAPRAPPSPVPASRFCAAP